MQIAVIIPCHNEELTVAKVVGDFRKHLPEASIFVFDNRSTDETAARAFRAGAQVIFSPRIGKGNAIKHAFESISADIYVMVDGDDTYSADQVQSLIQPLQDQTCDMVVGTRLADHSGAAFRRFHLFGNKFFSSLVSKLFGQKVSDILSGYRAFSRNFVQSVYLQSRGFEIETELTLQAISRGFIIEEVPLPYRERPEGSVSKLKTFDDGFLILKLISRLIRDYKPLPFFSIVSLLSALCGLMAGWAPISDYIHYAYVYTVPRAILAAGLMILSTVLFGVGLIMDSQVRLFQQQMDFMSSMKKSNSTSTEDQKPSIRIA